MFGSKKKPDEVNTSRIDSLIGEGTVIKREVYRYNIEPLRRSLVAPASLLLLVPFLSRSQQIMREFSLLAAVSTVATSPGLAAARHHSQSASPSSTRRRTTPSPPSRGQACAMTSSVVRGLNTKFSAGTPSAHGAEAMASAALAAASSASRRVGRFMDRLLRKFRMGRGSGLKCLVKIIDLTPTKNYRPDPKRWASSQVSSRSRRSRAPTLMFHPSVFASASGAREYASSSRSHKMFPSASSAVSKD